MQRLMAEDISQELFSFIRLRLLHFQQIDKNGQNNQLIVYYVTEKGTTVLFDHK